MSPAGGLQSQGMSGNNVVVVSSSQTHLEKLDSDAGKHEIQQHGDQDDVADGFDGHKHALDHVLPSHTNNALQRVFSASEVFVLPFTATFVFVPITALQVNLVPEPQSYL